MFVTYCDKRLMCRCQCGCVCVGREGGGGGEGKTFATCGIGQVLREVRMSWSSQHELVDATFRDIYEVEATSPLAILTTWQRLLAVACGSTSSTMRRLKRRSLSCLETILWASWEMAAHQRIIPWLDRVDSASNSVDGFSKGCQEGPWRNIQRGILPKELFQQ